MNFDIDRGYRQIIFTLCQYIAQLNKQNISDRDSIARQAFHYLISLTDRNMHTAFEDGIEMLRNLPLLEDYPSYRSASVDNTLYNKVHKKHRKFFPEKRSLSNYTSIILEEALAAYYFHLLHTSIKQKTEDTANTPVSADAPTISQPKQSDSLIILGILKEICNQTDEKSQETWQEILQLLSRKGYLQSPSGGGKVEVHGKEEIPSDEE